MTSPTAVLPPPPPPRGEKEKKKFRFRELRISRRAEKLRNTPAKKIKKTRKQCATMTETVNKNNNKKFNYFYQSCGSGFMNLDPDTDADPAFQVNPGGLMTKN